MKRSPPAASPDAYVSALNGWQRATVEALRKTTRAVDGLAETIKWGHLVYLSTGPVVLIRVEEHRVLFGFWRGQRLTTMDSRLKAGGKYEMATIEWRAGDDVRPRFMRRLVAAAVALDLELGDPTRIPSRRST